MSHLVILDAGPILNFLGAGREDLLFAAIAAISGEMYMPAVVLGEVRGKSRRDKRFTGVSGRLHKAVTAGTIRILDDEQDPGGELATQAEYYQRKLAVLAKRGDQPLTTKDLGEAMVLSHAARMRAGGATVRVLIDEWRGRDVAVGAKFPVISTETILFKAAKLGLISKVSEMKALWQKLRTLDDGLVPWDQATLLHQAGRYGEEAHLLGTRAAGTSGAD